MISVPEVCLDRRTAAKIASMSVSWLKRMDSIGAGPPKLRLGEGPGRVRYPVEKFMEWLQQHSEPARRADSANTHVV
jgi:predicted DNA-binding transcriptional regulator AlpA